MASGGNVPSWATMADWDNDSPVPAQGSPSASPSAPSLDDALPATPAARAIPAAVASPEPMIPGAVHPSVVPATPEPAGSVYSHWLNRASPMPARALPMDTPQQGMSSHDEAEDVVVFGDGQPMSPMPRNAAYQEGWHPTAHPEPQRDVQVPTVPSHYAGMPPPPPRHPAATAPPPANAPARPPQAAHPAAAGMVGRTASEASGPVRMRKAEAWARMTAYEACWQVCLQAVAGMEKEAECFLLDNCAMLKEAFGLSALALRPAAADGSEPARPSWMRLEGGVDRRDAWEAPGRKGEDWREGLGGVVFEDDAGGETGLGSGVSLERECLRIEVLRIKDKRRRAPRLLPPWHGPHADDGPHDLHVVLRPRSRPESAASVVRPHRAGGGSSIVLSAKESEEDLLVDLRDGATVLGRGAVPVAVLWDSLEEVEAALKEANGDVEGVLAGQAVRERMRLALTRLVRRATGRQEPAVLGALRSGDGGAQHKLQVLAGDGTYVGKVVLGLWRGGAGEGADGGGGRDKQGAGNEWNVNPHQAYDLTLAAALRNLGCGPRQLEVTKPWDWLLSRFAQAYGVSTHYCALAHLRWAVRAGNATPTADCFSVLHRLLSDVRTAAAEGRLGPHEDAVYRTVCRAVETLVAEAFEGYRFLSEDAPSGVDDCDHPPAAPAAALGPAVALFCLLRDPLHPPDQAWFVQRLQISARRRYMRLEASMAQGNRGATGLAPARGPASNGGTRGVLQPKTNAVGGGREGGGPEDTEGDGEGPIVKAGETPVMSREYRRLELLAQALIREVEADVRIGHAGAFPGFVSLAALTAEEHCRELVAKLHAVLRYRAPPQPTPQAVRMLVAVGRLEEFLSRAGVAPGKDSPGCLDARRLFQGHVLKWLAGSRAAIVAACNAAEGVPSDRPRGPDDLPDLPPPSPIAFSHNRHARPMCAAAEVFPGTANGEADRYKEVLVHWPVFGASVESALCGGARAALKLIARHHGGAPTAVRRAQGRPVAKAARGLAKAVRQGMRGADQAPWAGEVDGRGLPRLTAHEACVVNALKHLLTWAGDCEARLVEWCGGRPQGIAEEGAGSRPTLGQQLGQVRKELRSEYSAAVKNAVERLSAGMGMQRELSIRAVLKEAKDSDSMRADDLERALAPFFSAASDVLESCAPKVVPRAHIGIVRGVWDSAAREVHDFVAELSEGTAGAGAWKGRQAAAASLDIVDAFFKQLISKFHGGLSGKEAARDFELPANSDACHKLLGDGRNVLESYAVY